MSSIAASWAQVHVMQKRQEEKLKRTEEERGRWVVLKHPGRVKRSTPEIFHLRIPPENLERHAIAALHNKKISSHIHIYIVKCLACM